MRVPRLVPQQKLVKSMADGGGGDGEEQARRAALQRQAAAVSVAAEDYVRRLDAGAADVDLLGDESNPHAREDQGSSCIKVICRICFSGESEGSTKAQKMLSCKTCDKKYHRSCLKSWAEHRDLFHWSSWACPSCRICEVCQSAGDPNKLMFCRRCDGAYHCYCQQSPHKNVSHGPYVCPKHTRCHSCGSTVPGNDPSTSDEKYQQFQADQNLHYTCAACRGDCYQVKDIDDAVLELRNRKDIAEHKLIASLRASAGLPSQEGISPHSDDAQSCPVISKNDYGRSLKFSVKGLSDKFTKNSESVDTVSKNVMPNKNPTKKTIKFVCNAEGSFQNYEKQNGERSFSTFDGPESQHVGDKYSSIKEFGVNNVDRASKVQTDGWKLQGLQFKECTKTASKNETVKGTKLVIHLGSKNRNVSSSSKSETSSCHREQDFSVSYGNEDTSQPKTNDSENHMRDARGDGQGAKLDNTSLGRSSKQGDREENVIKLGIVSEKQRKKNGNINEVMATCSTSPTIAVKAVREVRPESGDEDILLKKKRSTSSTTVNLQTDGGHHTSRLKFVSTAASSDPKPLLKLKFKNPYFEQRTCWASRGEGENPVKGQRSKRKRPSTTEKVDASTEEEDRSATHHMKSPLTDQEMEANWILQKLGKNAIGKRVEVHQSSDNSWQKGVVSDVTIQGGSTSSSSLFVLLDSGRSTALDLGKQAVRFASQKQNKKAKTRY